MCSLLRIASENEIAHDPGMGEDEIIRLSGEELDLKQLARSFPTGPVRVEKHGDFHYLFRESEDPREDSEVLADGADTLAKMKAIVLVGDPAFRPPRISGISKKLPDGSLRTFINPTVHIQSRSAMSANITLLGSVVENKGSTEDQNALQLASMNPLLAEALRIYGSQDHGWVTLYMLLEIICKAFSGLPRLKSKNFVPGRDIDDLKEAAQSHRHAITDARPSKMDLLEGQGIVRKLLQGWLTELKHGESA